MSKLRILKRNIEDAFKSVFRNFSLSLASISCITITLILVAVAMLLSLNVNNFTEDIEKDVTIVVTLKREVEDEDAAALKKKIEKLSNIESVTFLSKEQIRLSMIDESDGLANILSQYNEEDNPLLNEYLVKVKNVEEIGKVAEKIKTFDEVYTVKYGEGMVEELVHIFDVVKKIMYIVVAGLIVVTAFLIGNTIKITINNRKRQIEIMRLVGASNSYIKIPFFIEGIILGFLGSIIPVLASSYGYIYLYEKLGGVFFTSVITLVNPDKVIFNISIVLVVIGVTVGALGSYRAVRRHLKI